MMRDIELSVRGKAAFGGLCAVCCGLPMLVILGVVSVGAAFAVGATVASALAVVVLTYVVVSHRATHVPAMARRMLVAGGFALSGFGLWMARTSADAAPAVLSVAVALLAAAALLVLASARSDYAAQ